jgi:hypothetical protein
VLLPSGPDTVRDSPLRGTRSSTSLEAAALESGDLGWEFSPAGADCRYRAPLVPRLARHRQSSADRRVDTPGGPWAFPPRARTRRRGHRIRPMLPSHEKDRPECATPSRDARVRGKFRRRPVAYSRHPGIDGAEPRSPRALGVAGEAKAARQHQTEPRRALSSSTPGGRRGEGGPVARSTGASGRPPEVRGDAPASHRPDGSRERRSGPIQRTHSPSSWPARMAERAGFEPATGCPEPHFQCGAIVH